MRLGFALCFVLAIGCGSGGGGNPGDDTSAPDANDLPPPDNGFQIRTPDITIDPGQEITYCYYTTLTDVTAAEGVKKWSSQMSPGSHHLIVFFTNTAEQPDGTLTPNCGFGGGGSGLPAWSYSSQQETSQLTMPDGVGFQVQPQQHLFVQLHYINTDPNNPITVHATIDGETYAPGVSYTPASVFFTYATDISIPGPSGTPGSSEHTCTVPSGKNFFTMGTHSHRRSVHTWVKDGNNTIVDSTDWVNPTHTDWLTAPYYQFSGQLTIHCDYINDLDMTVTSGDSAATNEMCMAVGYMFPATSPTICVDGFNF